MESRIDMENIDYCVRHHNLETPLYNCTNSMTELFTAKVKNNQPKSEQRLGVRLSVATQGVRFQLFN